MLTFVVRGSYFALLLKQERACPEREFAVRSPVLISHLDFGLKVCTLKKKKKYKMCILPRYFAHELLLGQVTAMEKNTLFVVICSSAVGKFFKKLILLGYL